MGTWRPVNAAAQVTVTARVSLPPLGEAVVPAQGQVRANPTAPAINAAGIVNGASFGRGEPVAPGSIISVFGRNLAAAAGGASGLPLPKTLAGATLNIGGQDVPLFYSSGGQINAQLPFELVPNSQPHVVVRATVPVEASVGGKAAVVQFAGLAPGFVGLYQVNVQIPGGVEAGSAIPLVLLQNGVPSNTVALAVR